MRLRNVQPVKMRRTASIPSDRSTRSPTVYSRNSEAGSRSTRSITADWSLQSTRPLSSMAKPSITWMLAILMAVTASTMAQRVS